MKRLLTYGLGLAPAFALLLNVHGHPSQVKKTVTGLGAVHIE